MIPILGGSVTNPSVTNFIHALEHEISLLTWSRDATPLELGLLFTLKITSRPVFSRKKLVHRTYVDAIINHMSGLGRVGVSYDGSSYNGDNRDFPGVPYTAEHFTPKNLCPSSSGIF